MNQAADLPAAPRPGPQSTPAFLPALDPKMLGECIDQFFPGGRAVSRDTCRAYAHAFYQDLDLEARGTPWQAHDLAFFARLPDLARACFALGREYRDVRPARMTVIGCGTGRHAASYVALARALGLSEIIFNDLAPEHIAATRARIRTLDAEGLSIRYVIGDAAGAALLPDNDLVIAMFFVSPEVCDFTSLTLLKRSRRRFYKGLARIMRRGGLFIEDVPERDLPNFYAELGDVTGQLLSARGLLPGAAPDLSLGFLPKREDGFPFDIRYIPRGFVRAQELHAAGLAMRYSWCVTADDGDATIMMPRIKRFDILTKARG